MPAASSPVLQVWSDSTESKQCIPQELLKKHGMQQSLVLIALALPLKKEDPTVALDIRWCALVEYVSLKETNCRAVFVGTTATFLVIWNSQSHRRLGHHFALGERERVSECVPNGVFIGMSTGTCWSEQRRVLLSRSICCWNCGMGNMQGWVDLPPMWGSRQQERTGNDSIGRRGAVWVGGWIGVGAWGEFLTFAVSHGIQHVASSNWLQADIHLIHLYLTSKRVESSSSSFSSLRGAISTLSAGVVIISYFRVFLIFLPDLYTLKRRHVISEVVNTQITMTMFLSVGRSFRMDEMRDPTVTSSVTLCKALFSSRDVEFSGAAGAWVWCSSPRTPQTTAIRSVKPKPYDSIVVFPRESDFYTNASYELNNFTDSSWQMKRWFSFP